MKVLVYSDSMLQKVSTGYARQALLKNANIDIHIESFLGKTAETAVQEEESKDNLQHISFFLAEDNYDVVILSWGTNDIGWDRPVDFTAKKIVKLVEFCSGVKRVFVIPPCNSPSDSKVRKELCNKIIELIPNKVLNFEFDNLDYLDEDLIHYSDLGVDELVKFVIEKLG